MQIDYINTPVLALFLALVAGFVYCSDHFPSTGQKFPSATIERAPEITRPSAHLELHNKGGTVKGFCYAEIRGTSEAAE